MDPTIWGPKLWDCLFMCAKLLPNSEAKSVFKSMCTLIPCVHCRDSYNYYYKIVPPDRHPPLKWLYVIHDMVNQKLGKQCPPFSRISDRLHCFTHYVSPYDVYDILIIIARAVDSEDAVVDFHTIVPLFQKIIRPTNLGVYLKLPAKSTSSPATLWLSMLACKNDFHKSLGEEKVSREKANEQYASLIAKPVIKKSKRK